MDKITKILRLIFFILISLTLSCSVSQAEESGRQWGIIIYYGFWLIVIVFAIGLVLKFIEKDK